MQKVEVNRKHCQSSAQILAGKIIIMVSRLKSCTPANEPVNTETIATRAVKARKIRNDPGANLLSSD